jgi:hypothetical protein
MLNAAGISDIEGEGNALFWFVSSYLTAKRV